MTDLHIRYRTLRATADGLMEATKTTCLFRNVLFMFYAVCMARLDPDPALISQTKAAIATAPGWARVVLTFGDEGMREAALNELAASIAARIENPPPEYDPAQFPLALRQSLARNIESI